MKKSFNKNLARKMFYEVKLAGKKFFLKLSLTTKKLNGNMLNDKKLTHKNLSDDQMTKGMLTD